MYIIGIPWFHNDYYVATTTNWSVASSQA